MFKQNIKSFFTYLQSKQTAQKYLHHCYQNSTHIDAESKSFENCEAFIYYIKHSQTFYEHGKNVPTELKPLLFFYGMTHLFKAMVLTKRPNYPETTKVLAHGVSSRKRKKKDYTFMDDEVKIQHHGLFTYFNEHIFNLKSKPFEKINMQHLLAIIPEMQELFHLHDQQTLIQVGKVNNTDLQFPINILDNYHLTKQAFMQRIIPYMPKITNSTTTQNFIDIQIVEPIDQSNLIFPFNLSHHSIYFPAMRHLFIPLPEIMAHYLLLYNLSMLSRYETEWWGDLLYNMDNIDYPFIKHFLHVTSEKVPIIIGNMLYHEHGR